MFKWIFKKFGSIPLDKALNQTKSIRINRVRFVIKKLHPLDYMSGAKVMLQYYDLYKNGKDAEKEMSVKKIKEHYADIFMATVVSPKLSRKPDEPYATFVDDLVNNWDLAEALYESIHDYTYGKKKASSGSLARS